MDELKKTKVTSVIEKLTSQSQEGLNQLQMLRADIARYEEALQKYSDFKDAEDFLMDGKRKLAQLRQNLEERDAELETARETLKEEQKVVETRSEQVRLKQQDLSLGLADLEDRMAKIKKLQGECELEKKRLGEQSDHLALRERRVAEREALFGRRWTALKELMDTAL